ncbi:MAG: hypothetical protein LBQ66_13445 [Planctomycetaceae bacterium]|jgi:hypothetical protein|nr:hypothetical protein [Planctomycetaceae bacterium]
MHQNTLSYLSYKKHQQHLPTQIFDCLQSIFVRDHGSCSPVYSAAFNRKKRLEQATFTPCNQELLLHTDCTPSASHPNKTSTKTVRMKKQAISLYTFHKRSIGGELDIMLLKVAVAVTIEMYCGLHLTNDERFVELHGFLGYG